MRTGLLAILLPLALSAGCMYQSRVNQQLLQRELRLEEDCIYRLKWQLEDTQRKLEATKAQMESLQKQADVLRERGSSGPDLSSPLAPSGGTGSGGSIPRLPPAPRLPSVEPGVEGPPSAPGSAPRSSIAPPKFNVAQTAAAAPDKSTLRPQERMNADVNVDHIVLNPGLNGGIDAEGQPGNDQLSVVIEQLDARNARVLAPGDVAIVVVDPALPKSESRIARWKFDADEVTQHVRRNRDGGSLHFELPWPTPPAHSDLRLFVRFTTYDGRRLDASLPIDVQLGDGAGKWRKSKAPVAENADERANTRRSVYEPNRTDDPTETASAASQRTNEHSSPSWAPYR